jgi:ribosomal protein S18 acetylase RimI-like enzyme
MPALTPTVRAARAGDLDRIAALLTGAWGDVTVVVHGTSYDAAALPALLAEAGDEVTGLLTYHVTGGGLEIVTLDAFQRQAGVGTALLAAAVDLARAAGLGRVWLVTTNDNIDALRFYQRRGLRITGISPGAVDAARAVKPSIPLLGDHGIELHDELTLELRINGSAG